MNETMVFGRIAACIGIADIAACIGVADMAHGLDFHVGMPSFTIGFPKMAFQCNSACSNAAAPNCTCCWRQAGKAPIVMARICWSTMSKRHTSTATGHSTTIVKSPKRIAACAPL
jgi:hypothetical protein